MARCEIEDQHRGLSPDHAKAEPLVEAQGSLVVPLRVQGDRIGSATTTELDRIAEQALADPFSTVARLDGDTRNMADPPGHVQRLVANHQLVQLGDDKAIQSSVLAQ